ncbi:hypothetical protein V496_05212 [Pseudogymnoascus sp. VKM F-4515 (FW-2607)]|nr:hypothetical protein V496_05212 [Pseudogymnoascus sp. VKM F-4515 (FW-2607)]KFY98203.1 hypothetical protein V498_01609 [Pseudogymnoascus sp. VKM F-4517 (FW-2822)]
MCVVVPATSAIGLEDAGTAWKPPPAASSAYKTSNLPRTQFLFFLLLHTITNLLLLSYTKLQLLFYFNIKVEDSYTNTT